VSGLGGLLAPADTVVDPTALERLASALAPRGGDSRCPVEPGLAFVQAARREPEDRPEMRWGDLWLAWDGRLDNREALDAALGEEGSHDRDRLALAYRRWGMDFLDRLEGDFALALWDGRARRLVLARDAMGVRPLFYTRAARGLVWASTLQAVRAASGAHGGLDEEWVAGFFAHAVDAGVTPLRAVKAVPPGHAVVFENESARARAFWTPGLRPAHSLPDDGAYEERFAELFVEAVRCRLAEGGAVAAELSGGLDSSSIACVAHDLIRDGRAAASELLTISWVYPGSPTSDEVRFVRLVEDRIGRPGRHLGESDGPAFAGLETPEYDHPTLLECVKGRRGRGYEAMRERGARVLLSGFGGDQLLHSEFEAALPLADLLWSGRLRAFALSLRTWHALEGEPYPALLGRSLALACSTPRRVMGRRLQRSHRTTFSCLDPAFVRRTHLHERLAAAALPGGDGPPGKRHQVAAVRSAIQAVSWLYDTGGWPVEASYPFLHRPLVDFCLAVPGEQFMRPGETRSLHRRALRAWLPPGIAQRQDKRGPDEAFLRELAVGWERVGPLLEDAEVVRRGIVEAGAFRRALDEARFGHLGGSLPILMKAIALEAWLRGKGREL
jgi:asparagine synthase (glutamine-hydrolysing)